MNDLEVLAALGVEVAIADHLPRPWLLLPDYSVVIIDGRLEATKRTEELRVVVGMVLEEIVDPPPD